MNMLITLHIRVNNSLEIKLDVVVKKICPLCRKWYLYMFTCRHDKTYLKDLPRITGLTSSDCTKKSLYFGRFQ